MAVIPQIVQVGLGNFGKRHLEAWHRLGLGDQLWIAEPNEAMWVETERFRFPKERLVRSLDEVIDRVDMVDIVTPTDSHAASKNSMLTFTGMMSGQTSCQAPRPKKILKSAEGRPKVSAQPLYWK